MNGQNGLSVLKKRRREVAIAGRSLRSGSARKRAAIAGGRSITGNAVTAQEGTPK
jgi:hypothetical protein